MDEHLPQDPKELTRIEEKAKKAILATFKDRIEVKRKFHASHFAEGIIRADQEMSVE